jgi:hypothetical protein
MKRDTLQRTKELGNGEIHVVLIFSIPEIGQL